MGSGWSQFSRSIPNAKCPFITRSKRLILYMLQRNQNLIINICEVQVKSAHGSMFPALAAIYSSLSKIKWTCNPKLSDSGILYSNKLSLSYPGLSIDQFTKLDELLNGLFEVVVKTEEGDRFQISGEENPMGVDANFNNGMSDISFDHVAIEPIKYLGNTIEEAEPLGFPYYLTFNLA